MLQNPDADKQQSYDLEAGTTVQAALLPESYRIVPSGVGMGTFELFSAKGKAALRALVQRSAELGDRADEDD